jgi:hypothetical protein
MGTKNNPGKYDCYEAAGPDEPMFILLARDPLAPILVDLWASLRAHTAGNPSKVAEARACAASMRDWKRAADAPPPAPQETPRHSRECLMEANNYGLTGCVPDCPAAPRPEEER